MIERRSGEMTTLETRAESYEALNANKRYEQITECLAERSCLTAKEIAVMMMRKGYIPTAERNFTAPRLTEMMHKGMVEPVGRKRCQYTRKSVTVYRLRVV